jgi:DNA-binding transcriptional LysR family regulator
MAAAYRRSRPGIDIRIRDTDLTDPTCGLRAGMVDVALTRAPFDETALTVRALRTDPVGLVLRADDPLARRDGLRLAELSDRRRDATQHVENARPEKTRNGYGADWNAWLRFCAEQDLPPAAVRSGTLVAFVEWCWTQPARPPQPGRPPGKLTALSTIDRRLSGVVVTARRQLRGCASSSPCTGPRTTTRP